MDEMHLILFSRAPNPGQTKTRLASDVGDEAALAFHVACLQDLIDECTALGGAGTDRRVVRHLFLTPAASLGAFAAAGIRGLGEFTVHDQQGGTLGQRMAGAFATVLRDSGHASRALLFGSDIPLLTAQHLERAYRALEDAQAVFCPTPDGGYCMIGLREPCNELFELPRWSHGAVLDQSLAAARRAGVACALIEPLPDVDTTGDLHLVAQHALFSELAHRKSVRWISQWIARQADTVSE